MPAPNSLLVTAIVTALVGFGAISTDLYLPSLPAIAGHFRAETGAAQLTLSVFLVGFAVSQLVYGPLSDRFGRRPVLVGGLLIFTAASTACALADSLAMLIVARFFQALGACAGPVLGRAIVRDIYGREQAARVMSYISTAMALAPALGPILGGVIQDWLGWRANFGALVAIGMIALLAVLAALPETNRWRDPAATGPARLFGNYVGLLADPLYRGYVLICALAYAGLFAFISGSSFVLIETLGLTPLQFGLCFASMVTGYMAGTFTSARLTLRLGLERLVAAGAWAGCIGGALGTGFTLAGLVTLPTLLAPVFLFALGAGLMLPNAIAGAIGPFPEKAGSASALLGFLQMLLASLVGIGVGQFHDGSGRSMTLAIAAMGLGAMLCTWRLARLRAAAPGAATS